MTYESRIAFNEAPLITVEDVEDNPAKALAILPAWGRHWGWASDDSEELRAEGQRVPVVVLLGRTQRRGFTLDALQFAFLAEVTRWGHSVQTNTNSGKPTPRFYAKLIFRDAAKDNIPIARIFLSAGEHEAVHTVELASDLRLENLVKLGAGKPTKDAAKLVFKHCERLVREREAGGTLPEGITVASYLANLRNLHEAIFAKGLTA